MLWQRINRSSAEKCFVLVYNSYSTASITNGQAVARDFQTDADGLGVTRPTARATNGGIAAAGIIAETIAAGSYGLMQVYGYHSAVRMRVATGGSPGIVAGRPLAINAAGSLFCAESMSTASNVVTVFPFGFSLSTLTTWTTAAGAALVKSL